MARKSRGKLANFGTKRAAPFKAGGARRQQQPKTRTAGAAGAGAAKRGQRKER